ncbi:MAG: hypothetical protein MUC63_03960 [Planctomycetes bacterium]|jgi:hypothetical protein|nr:hypothetical protein [Planctomycetota bacterium]
MGSTDSKPFWVTVAAVLLPIVVLAALLALFPRRPADEALTPGSGAPRAPSAVPGSGPSPVPDPEAGAAGAPIPGSRANPAPASGGTAAHPLLGPVPGAPKEPDAGPNRPALTAEELERSRDESIRKVEENLREMRKRERETFEGILGPLEDEKAKAFQDAYSAYYDEASREFRSRIEKGEKPDRNAVYAAARDRMYGKLAGVLDPAQLQKFRTWMEEQCFPRRD